MKHIVLLLHVYVHATYACVFMFAFMWHTYYAAAPVSV